MIEEEANERWAKRVEDDLMTEESIIVAVRVQVELPTPAKSEVSLNSEPITCVCLRQIPSRLVQDPSKWFKSVFMPSVL